MIPSEVAANILRSCLVIVLAMGLMKIQTSLKEIKGSIYGVESQVNLQTAQHDWLVTHYAKPVRGIFPWDKNKCVYCGSETNEGDGPIVVWKVINCQERTAVVKDEKDKIVVKDLTVYNARVEATKLARLANKNVSFKFFIEDENGLLMEEGE